MSAHNGLLYRVLQPADAEVYISLRLEALQANPEAFLTTYEETIRDENLVKTFQNRLSPNPNSCTMGAFHNGQLVGVATMIRDNRDKIRHKASLVAVYTTESHRGKGISKALITQLIAKAKEMDGLEQINLTVWSDNVAACRLYESLGFHPFGKEANAMKFKDKYWDETYMALKL
ncbi:MAG: N-acetyltransferase family protein [Clostridia bacterium]